MFHQSQTADDVERKVDVKAEPDYTLVNEYHFRSSPPDHPQNDIKGTEDVKMKDCNCDDESDEDVKPEFWKLNTSSQPELLFNTSQPEHLNNTTSQPEQESDARWLVEAQKCMLTDLVSVGAVAAVTSNDAVLTDIFSSEMSEHGGSSGGSVTLTAGVEKDLRTADTVTTTSRRNVTTEPAVTPDSCSDDAMKMMMVTNSDAVTAANIAIKRERGAESSFPPPNTDGDVIMTDTSITSDRDTVAATNMDTDDDTDTTSVLADDGSQEIEMAFEPVNNGADIPPGVMTADSGRAKTTVTGTDNSRTATDTEPGVRGQDTPGKGRKRPAPMQRNLMVPVYRRLTSYNVYCQTRKDGKNFASNSTEWSKGWKVLDPATKRLYEEIAQEQRTTFKPSAALANIRNMLDLLVKNEDAMKASGLDSACLLTLNEGKLQCQGFGSLTSAFKSDRDLCDWLMGAAGAQPKKNTTYHQLRKKLAEKMCQVASTMNFSTFPYARVAQGEYYVEGVPQDLLPLRSPRGMSKGKLVRLLQCDITLHRSDGLRPPAPDIHILASFDNTGQHSPQPAHQHSPQSIHQHLQGPRHSSVDVMPTTGGAGQPLNKNKNQTKKQTFIPVSSSVTMLNPFTTTATASTTSYNPSTTTTNTTASTTTSTTPAVHTITLPAPTTASANYTITLPFSTAASTIKDNTTSFPKTNTLTATNTIADATTTNTVTATSTTTTTMAVASITNNTIIAANTNNAIAAASTTTIAAAATTNTTTSTNTILGSATKPPTTSSTDHSCVSAIPDSSSSPSFAFTDSRASVCAAPCVPRDPTSAAPLEGTSQDNVDKSDPRASVCAAPYEPGETTSAAPLEGTSQDSHATDSRDSRDTNSQDSRATDFQDSHATYSRATDNRDSTTNRRDSHATDSRDSFASDSQHNRATDSQDNHVTESGESSTHSVDDVRLAVSGQDSRSPSLRSCRVRVERMGSMDSSSEASVADKNGTEEEDLSAWDRKRLKRVAWSAAAISALESELGPLDELRQVPSNTRLEVLRHKHPALRNIPTYKMYQKLYKTIRKNH